MTVLEKGILTLIKSSVTGEKYPLPEGFLLEAEETRNLIKKHNLMLLIYVGALNCGISKELPVMKDLFAAYYKHFVYCENQMLGVQKIFQAFDAHGIDYLPTKGCVLRAIYPKPEMRSMGDADLTIRKEQCHEIRKIMQNLGFECEMDNELNLVWDSKLLHVELHLQMRSWYNDIYTEEKYYKDIWSRVKHVQGHRYEFSRIEDQYIHVFNHFARHYRTGGVGCRHLTDVYVMRLKYPEMDENYIYKEMETLQLHKFYKNVMELLDVWFENGTFTPVTKLISDYIFNSGNWGSKESHAAANMVSYANETGKTTNFRAKEIFKTIFPSVEFLKRRFPILEKAPYLLPFIWIRRWFMAVFVKRKQAALLAKEWKHITDENVLEYQDHYKYVGLNFEK